MNLPLPTDPRAVSGIWLPRITPWRDDRLDETSLRRLVSHYASEPVDGLVLSATTGEGLTLEEVEKELTVAAEVVALTARPLPLYPGLSGSFTRHVAADLARPIDGYLITCPYYTRPAQEGLYAHFATLADATARPILIYNIPYRTGVNMHNETMLRLAEHDNVVGVKDCCTVPTQSLDLLRRRPPGFAVLTGEDTSFHGALAQGADGGILASAHVEISAFATVRDRLVAGDQHGALQAWYGLVDLPRLLVSEPSPAPIKHWLWRMGLTDRAELRLPMTPVSGSLAAVLDREIARRNGGALTA